MRTSLILLMLLFVAAGCGGTEESSTNPTSLASPVSTTVSSAATLTPTPAPPVPTSAPEPDRTPTSVPIPTDTPDPTPVDTSAPTPTNTPVPEGTPEPTPLPTQTPLPPPGVVVDLEIANVTENSITLQWKPPDNSNVVPIEHYEVTRDIAFRPDEHHAVAETTFIDTELESSTEHRYRVRAIGPGGIEGAEISIVGSTLDSATPAPNRTPIPEPTPTDTPQPTATRTSLPTATATLTPVPTSTPTSEPTQTPTPEPTPTVEPVATAEPMPTAEPTASPTPEPELSLGPGTHKVGTDIEPGVYAGKAGIDVSDWCSWKRLSGVTGDSDDVIAIEIEQGQFYVEILPTDKYFNVACEITPLADWPIPDEHPTKIEQGTYLIGRDISPGVYAGKAGIDVSDWCSWKRLSGVTGDSDDVIAIEIEQGQFYVEILPTDKYFNVACEITPLADWPIPDEHPTKIEQGTYLIGRDISPGTYAGKAGIDVSDWCSWKRLSGVTGDSDDVIAIEIEQGQFYVTIEATDYAFTTACELTLSE